MAEVVFHPLAEADLDGIDDRIAQHSPRAADAFIERLQQVCRSLAEFPLRGQARPNWGEGVRSIGIDRTVLLAYQVADGRVTILRLFYAGQDFEAAMGSAADD